MAQKRRKDKVSGKTIRKIIILIILLIVVILVGMRYLKKKVADNFAQQEDSNVETTQVTTGSISTTVTGSGTLKNEDSEEIEIPATVTLSKIYVENGDTVEEGDLLATVDSSSVLSSMSEIQEDIEELDEKLADAEDDSASGTVKASVSGRVKAINVEVGDDVPTVMYEKGALMILSLDGYMAVDVPAGDLESGDSVKVKVSDTSYTGTVDQVIDKTATVLISDKTAAIDDEAKITSGDKEIGSGKLYVHESLAVTGYAGTVKALKVKVNTAVDAGDTLMTLKDTSYSANYTALLKERTELEEKLSDLIAIYKKGAVYATCAGTLTEVTDNSETASESAAKNSSNTSMSGFGAMMGTSSSSTATSEDDPSVFAICPNKEMILSVSVDETNILSVEEDQEAVISVDSISDQTFSGKVTSIETTGTSSSGVTTYTVEITMDKDASMMSGMSASAAITIEGVENALLLPFDAVTKTRDTAYVYTSYDEETDTLGGMTEVKVGISNGSSVEITEGLKEGDTVYYKEESSDNAFTGFGGGQMPGGFSGGDMPSDFSGGNMPGGGSMPSGFSGGGKSNSSGGGQMPSGFSGGPGSR